MYSSDMKTTILVLLYKNNLDHLLMKEYLLNFEGYWRDCNKNGLPIYGKQKLLCLQILK